MNKIQRLCFIYLEINTHKVVLIMELYIIYDYLIIKNLARKNRWDKTLLEYLKNIIKLII